MTDLNSCFKGPLRPVMRCCYCWDCDDRMIVMAAVAILDKHGRPKHPLHLTEHRCIGYSYTMNTEVWRFTKGSKSASVRPLGPLRANHGDAMMPALIAGTGLGILPEFFLREALECNRLERLLRSAADTDASMSRLQGVH
jgi:DNA-binding transcriptional LysR family regulator